MEENVYLDKLERRDIKPTAIRLLILKNMLEVGRAVSLLDLETLLDTVDKSTISRTIALFLSHHLIHSIDDGSGSLKYATTPVTAWCRIYTRISIVRNVIGLFVWKVHIFRLLICLKDSRYIALIMFSRGFVRNVLLIQRMNK